MFGVDYGARMLMLRGFPILMGVDPLGYKTPSISVFAYCFNNPVMFIDPTGMEAGDFRDQKGRYLGSDGVNDGANYVVTDRGEANDVKRTNNDGGITSASSLNSAVRLPSVAALSESLNVLDRTVKNGGMREEVSLVTNDGNSIRGESGPEYKVGDAIATASVPGLPNGLTNSDVEASIHSHLTATVVSNGTLYFQTASEMGPNDSGVFAKYPTNIIVGPLGKINSFTNGVVPSRPNGIAIYGNGSSSPSLQLEEGAVRRILK